MPSWRRSLLAVPLASRLAAPFAALAVLLAAHPAQAKPKSPIELTVQSEAGAQLAGAAVVIEAESGEPFAVEGVTDKRGRYATKLPDFSRVYSIRVSKDGFVEFTQSVDFAAQNLAPDATASLTVTLPAENLALRLYNEGAQALRQGQVEVAREKLLLATKENASLGEGWKALAVLEAQEKSWALVLQYAERAAQHLASDEALAHLKYEALVELGKSEEAMAQLDTIAANFPSRETARLLFNQGAQALSNGLLEAAKQRFVQAYVMEPTLYQAHSAVAEVLIREKNYEAALGELDIALNLAPADKKVAKRRIEVLRQLGRKEDADAAEKKLAELGD